MCVCVCGGGGGQNTENETYYNNGKKQETENETNDRRFPDLYVRPVSPRTAEEAYANAEVSKWRPDPSYTAP